MAKGIEMNGQLRGKRGGVVYYRADGQQISRSRNFNPKNPQTMPQMIQRLMLANASKAAVGFKEIIDHSFETVQYGAKSVRHFEKLAQQTIKSLTPSQVGSDKVTPCVPLDALGYPVAPFLVSSGTLASAKYELERSGNGAITAIVNDGFSGISDLTAVTVQNFLDAFGVTIEDQLTFVCAKGKDSLGGAGSEYIFEDNEVLPAVRLNFKSDAASQTMFNADGTIKAAVLVDEKSTLVTALEFDLDEGVLTIHLDEFLSEHPMSAFALIVSRYEDGRWRRSTESLAVAALAVSTIGPDTLEHWGWNDWGSIQSTLVKGDNPSEEYFLNKEDN